MKLLRQVTKKKTFYLVIDFDFARITLPDSKYLPAVAVRSKITRLIELLNQVHYQPSTRSYNSYAIGPKNRCFFGYQSRFFFLHVNKNP